mmetsp:Transcript_14000/g.27160  ORF Transcript_14000/g.27160 Transcript_14000/m.27160 type:complete len:140 (-) Transcript_14000:204-623(-)
MPQAPVISQIQSAVLVKGSLPASALSQNTGFYACVDRCRRNFGRNTESCVTQCGGLVHAHTEGENPSNLPATVSPRVVSAASPPSSSAAASVSSSFSSPSSNNPSKEPGPAPIVVTEPVPVNFFSKDSAAAAAAAVMIV